MEQTGPQHASNHRARRISVTLVCLPGDVLGWMFTIDGEFHTYSGSRHFGSRTLALQDALALARRHIDIVGDRAMPPAAPSPISETARSTPAET